MPFLKVYLICSKSSCLKNSYTKMDISFPEMGSSICSLWYWMD
uniref:Alternative protein FAM46A n=1 Tax=Homo sapiens TaxID=9606 RepID=L8E8C7_HUMAN|nr:alternative protein FAM46A [Homo sapiens]